MPTYQYTCTGCDERIEVVQKFTDDPLTDCAVCGSRLRKVFSPVGIVFKGSGFYRTDSRAAANGSNGSKDERKDKEHAASGESSSASQSDTGGDSSKSSDSKSSGDSKSSDSSSKSDSRESSGGKRAEKVA